MKKRTIEQWLRTLPLDLREQALENFKLSPVSRDAVATTLADAISSAFAWRDTKQGLDYWVDIENRARQGEFNVNTLEELTSLILQWGIDKGITGPNGRGTKLGQAEKMMEEAQETIQCVQFHEQLSLGGFPENDPDFRQLISDTQDGIGDTFVTLVLLAELHGWSIAECVQHAYDEIKGRTGKMVNGTFVKDGKEGA